MSDTIVKCLDNFIKSPKHDIHFLNAIIVLPFDFLKKPQQLNLYRYADIIFICYRCGTLINCLMD